MAGLLGYNAGSRKGIRPRFSALSREALKGPFSKLNGIGHAIRSEPHELATQRSRVECLFYSGTQCWIVKGGGFLEPIAPLLVPQAGVLGSQPPVPVIALTGDDPAGAFPRRIASQIDTDR